MNYTKVLYLFTSIFVLSAGSILAQDKAELKQIKDYFNAKRYEEAKKLLDKNIAAFPKNSDVQFLMGKYYYQKQQSDKARYHLLKALEYSPSHTAAKEILVNLEIAAKHYSSAVCYVNELLETSPYDAELWRKKIAIYREQGNDIEADRLLKRIRVIYPEDAQFKKDYLYSLQVQSVQEKKKGNIDEAIKRDEELLRLNPKDEQAYVNLINSYLIAGDKEKALTYANRGLQHLPNNKELMNRKVGILTDMNRYVEAVEFIQQEMKKGNRTPEMARNYNSLLSQAAVYQNQNDPYVLYGKLYETNPQNQEALDYLINNAVTKGYYDDAFTYIEKGIKAKGRTKELLSKKYWLLRRTNRSDEAYRVLTELYEKYPNDSDIRNEYILYQYNTGQELVQQGRYAEAIPPLEFVASQTDLEWREDAMGALFGAYLQNKNYDKALAQAEQLTELYPDHPSGFVRKASALAALGKYDEALAIYQKLIVNSSTPEDSTLYIDGYEETALVYIKSLNEQGNTAKAYEVQKELLAVKENSNQGLKYHIATASLLGENDDALSYAQKGKELYPDDLYFVQQEAHAYTHTDRPEQAIEVLDPYVQQYTHNPELTKAYSEASKEQAQKAQKAREYDEAHATLSKALTYDPLNKELKYERGRVFEGQRVYDSAYYYQKNFQPSLVELSDFKAHLNYLKYKTYKNEMQFSYQQNELKDSKIPGIFSAVYNRYQRHNTYTIGLASSGRADKRAFQGQVGWEHQLNDRWYFEINGALSNHYFPEYMGNITVHRALPKDWEAEVGVGYKKLRTTENENLIQVHLGGSKTLDDFTFSLKATELTMGSALYYNTFARIQYDLLSKRSFLAIFGGVGSAPVDEILNNQLYDQFSTTNASFGGMGQYMISDRLAFSLSGVWYNYYNGVEYSDLYNLIFGLYVSF